MVSDGHEMFLALLEKHGRDRYPEADDQLGKIFEELWELAEALDDLALSQSADMSHLRKELGDVGLSLYGLAVKLGMNLNECMADVLRNETRTFT